MTEDGPTRVGLVLAGGYSRRFGPVEKALAPVYGTPMLRRVVDRVEPVTDAVVVNCRADQRADFAHVLSDSDGSIAFAIDPVAGRGPLAGVRAGLAVHDAAETVLVACDQPFIEPATLAGLCANRGTASAVVPRSDGHRQPTPSVLSTCDARRAAADAVSAGERSLRALFDRLDVCEIEERRIDPPAGRGVLRDVDVPTELPDR